MSISKQQCEFALNVARLIAYINVKKYGCTLGEAYRTEEQAKIYAKLGTGVVDSQHRKRLAVDLNLFSPKGEYLTRTKDHEPFGVFWESLHPKNKWGGRRKKPDGNHYERESD